MNNKTLHIIGNEFTRHINHTDEWWKNRLNVYEYFCLNSIKQQTNKNFLLLMSLDWVPSHVCEKIKQILDRSGLKYIIHIIKDVSFSEIMKPFVDDFEIIYHTRIDSDDLFHKNAVEEIQSYDFENRRALVFQKGYCYDIRENKLRHYFMPSPPFSTIMYPMNIYIDKQKQEEYKNFRSHDTLVQKMPYISLSENKFIVNVHGTNRITTFENNRGKYRGYNDNIDIPISEINNILNPFGINSNTYNEKVKQN
jgi:hypothetical protein